MEVYRFERKLKDYAMLRNGLVNVYTFITQIDLLCNEFKPQ